MRGTQLKKLKRILEIHERPSRMTKGERAHYRAIKKRFNRQPRGEARVLFLDNLVIARQMVKAQIEQQKVRP